VPAVAVQAQRLHPRTGVLAAGCPRAGLPRSVATAGAAVRDAALLSPLPRLPPESTDAAGARARQEGEEPAVCLPGRADGNPPGANRRGRGEAAGFERAFSLTVHRRPHSLEASARAGRIVGTGLDVAPRNDDHHLLASLLEVRLLAHYSGGLER